jgi:putative intracellular protease/amidase
MKLSIYRPLNSISSQLLSTRNITF